ncbi:MAG: right-handed parallel beta-helix repeat-containing protein [Bacteroidales bacterium]|nr:right-handed parallel beta-helix repeat-containing protein [Bacteroidales bacterium]
MKVIRNIFAVLAALTMMSCVEQVDDTGFTPETPEISFGEESLSVEKNGGELTVMLNSNLPWRIKSSASWVTPSVTYASEGCEIVLAIQKNRLRESRTATLTAYVTEDAKASLTVVQDPADASESITYHIKTDGDPLSDGGSWETATTLATALYNAGDGDVLLLAAGTYAPAALLTGGKEEKEKTFEIHSNFTMEGGYPADASTGAVVDPAANETVLSGVINAGTNAYHAMVVTAPASDDMKVVLRNLTISGGATHTVHEEKILTIGDSSFDHSVAGGMYIGSGCKVEMDNCRVTGNNGFNTAGIHILQYADVVMRRCDIIGNTATGNGGGVWNQGAVLRMYDCNISDNQAHLGAGLYSIDHKATKCKSVNRLYNCTVSGNRCKQYGGGSYLRARTDAVFVNCTFTGNVAGQKGGGIMVNGETGSVNVWCVLINSTVTGNKNEGESKYGAGLFQHNTLSSMVNYNSIISGNVAGDTASDIEKDASVSDAIPSYRSVVGTSVTDETATAISGLTFNASSMLGTFDLYGSSRTKCFPLTGSDNPAVTGGYAPQVLVTMFTDYAPFDADWYVEVEPAMLALDQTGASREGTASIGSCLSK